MPPLPTLVCKQCGYVNEGERVYCHGCGAKLDRDVIASAAPPPPSMEEQQKEVKKIMSPRRGLLGREARTFLRMLVVAALAAGVVCAVRKPDGAVPLDEKRELAETPALVDLLEGVLAMPSAQRRGLGEKDINAYLRNERFRRVPAWFASGVELRRVYVNLEPGSARLMVGGMCCGVPLYAGWTGYFRPGQGKSGMEAVCTGGFIGRLPVHPKLAAMTLGAVPLVVSSAEEDMRLIRRLAKVELLKGKVVLTTRPAPAPKKGVPEQAVVDKGQPGTTAPANRSLPSPSLSPMQGGFH